MVVSVNTRKHEFATLESIGMTKKQIRNVLLWEGGYYWSISFLLLATLGTAIYIPIYSAFRKMVPYAAFHYPVFSLLVVAAIVLLVCLATPVITFMQNVKQSVVAVSYTHLLLLRHAFTLTGFLDSKSDPMKVKFAFVTFNFHSITT